MNTQTQFTERESELIYFALSRLLDDFAIDGVQDVNDNDEINEIINLREKFAQTMANGIQQGEIKNV